MSDVQVARDARHRSLPINGMRESSMAVAASGFGHSSIHTVDLNAVRIMSRGESQAVVKTIDGFHEVLTQKVGWRMAIVAGSDMTVTGFDPAIILRTHRVAVDTGFGIITEIRDPVGIEKSVGTKSSCDSEQRGKSNKC